MISGKSLKSGHVPPKKLIEVTPKKLIEVTPKKLIEVTYIGHVTIVD